MELRSHQKEFAEICDEILHTNNSIKEIILSVTPGGGKSFIPVITAIKLLPSIAEKLCWVVPRNSLKYQGEEEFLNPAWNTKIRLRAADNGVDLSRGLEGYITTYQAIGQDPECHKQEFTKHRYILILDEEHHVSKDSTWETAIQPLVELSALVVYASGTLSRDDGKCIAFMPYSRNIYSGSLELDLENTKERRVIQYSRKQAIKENAILDVKFIAVDGEAEWEEKDGTKKSSLLSGEESAKALFTALRSGFAEQLLLTCFKSWVEELKVYPKAKMLVVAPNIEVANTYHEFLVSKKLAVRIATSDDSVKAREDIKEFKRHKFNILVTVAMAYEGLSVPEITHICCLTHIRSVPWLEQCFARGNRLAKGKTRAFCFAPRDHMFLKAVKMINCENLVPVDEATTFEIESEEKEKGEYEKNPWITVIGSKAYTEDVEIKEIKTELTPSEKEKMIRKSINDKVKKMVSAQRSGSIVMMSKIIHKKIKTIVNKPVAEMTAEELEKIQTWIQTL